MIELYDAKGTRVGMWGSDAQLSGKVYYYPLIQLSPFVAPPTNPTFMAATVANLANWGVGQALIDNRGERFGGSLTGLVLDGHVPSTGSDLVEGLQSGTYEVRAYVTGYVMDEADVWQRKITVPESIGVATGWLYFEMDLRRSNWLEPTVHLETVPRVQTGMGLVAVGSDGREKGVAGWTVPGNVLPLTGFSYRVILEGWSETFNAWRTDLATRDYGLPPGTYDTRLYMADMGDQSGYYYGLPGILGRGWYTMREKPLATIALCNSPSAYSFRTRLSSIFLYIRSVDFQVPAMPVAWQYPGAEVWVDILDEKGTTVASISPLIWGLFQDPTAFSPSYFWSANTLRVRFTGTDTDAAWAHYNALNIPWTGGFAPLEGEILAGDYPTSLPAGTYNFRIRTVGYVARRTYPVSILEGAIGDIQADMIVGGVLRVYFRFESQLQPVPFLGPVRVEVFDAKGTMVGAEVYGRTGYSGYNPGTDFKFAPGAAGPFREERAWMARRFYAPFIGPTWRWWPRNFARDNYYAIPSPFRVGSTAGATAEMDVFGFYMYTGGPCTRNEGGLWANAYDATDATRRTADGIRGSVDAPGVSGGGKYTVKVWAFDPFNMRSFYHAAIPSVEVYWGGVISGTTDVYVTLNSLGRLSGYVTWTDMYGNLRYAPWAKISAGAAGATYSAGLLSVLPAPGTFVTGAAYNLWLPPGTYTVEVTPTQGVKSFTSYSFAISASDGAVINIPAHLEPTGVPIPEFTATPIVLISALAASLFILRRRKKTAK